MRRKSKKLKNGIEQTRQSTKSLDKELLESWLAQQFEEESNKIVLTDAAAIKAEQKKGDQTQEIY